MSNPTPILNNINAFDATQGTIISFNIIGGTEIVRSNIVYIYDLGTNDLICTHLYISTESIHELPPNTDPSIVYADGKSSADFVNNKNYYLQVQTFTNTAGTTGGSGMSVAKTFWCLFDPALSVNAIPAAISTTSYNVGATYTTNITDVTIPVTNIIQQYKFDLYTATGTLVQTSGNIIGSGEQEGTSTTYNITYNFSGLVVNNSYYVVVTTTSTEGMTVSAQSNTFTVSIDTPTLGEATVVNNACDGYISVTSNLSGEYGGSASGETASFVTNSINDVSSLKVNLEPIQDGTPWNATSADKTPYNFRKVPSVGHSINSEYDKIVGGTVAWNQLCFDRGTPKSDTMNGITWSISDDGSTVTANGTATANSYFRFMSFEGGSIPAGHKLLLLRSQGNSDVLTEFAFRDADGNSLYDSTSTQISIVSFNKEVTGTYCQNRIYSGTTVSNVKVIKPLLFDLTALFGNSAIADYVYNLEQATAGAGIAWLKEHFPKMFNSGYMAYDAGTLKSVEGLQSHDTVGFNLWDEEWEVGAVNSLGVKTTNNSMIRSKNYFQCMADTSYYFTLKNRGVIHFYDANYEHIVYTGEYAYENGVSPTNGVFVSPSNAKYLLFRASTAYGTTYKNDICINISKTTGTPKNGDYAPYVKHTYTLDSDLVLRGIPKLDASNNLYYDGDTYASDGTVTRRYGIVDLGTLTWGYSGGFFRTAGLNGLVKRPTTNANKVTAISDGYEVMTWNAITNTSNKCFAVSSGSDNAIFCNTAYTDAATFKTAMSGVYLVYELATPTTETADSYTNPQVVDADGTEEYVTTSIVPVGHETYYADIYPISGYDEVNVNIHGKNLLPNKTGQAGTAQLILGDDASAIASASGVFLKSGTYTISVNSSKVSSIYWYDVVNNSSVAVGNTTEPRTITVASDGYYFPFLYNANGISASDVTDYQLELGTTATAYEPYNGQTYTQEIEATYTPTVQENEPYQFKRTGDVGGDRESIELVGGSVAWNQMMPNIPTTTASGITMTNNGDGTYTLSGVASATQNFPTTRNFKAIAGHKYLYMGTTDKIRGGLASSSVSGSSFSPSSIQYYDTIYNCVSSGTGTDNNSIALFGVTSGTDLSTAQKIMPQLIDLTQFFGSSTIPDYVYSLEQATAGAGIAWLRKYYPKLFTYNPYNTGELISVNASSHDTVGFNQWDEETRNGYYNLTTGAYTASTSYICNANLIDVLPNTTYCITAPSGINHPVFFYDYDGNFISRSGTNFAGVQTFTTPSNCYKLAFFMDTPYGTTYNNDICINISDPTKNGTYEPYVKNTYPLDSSITLRGLPKLSNGKLYYDGDTYRSDGLHSERYGVKTYDGSTGAWDVYNGVFYAGFSGYKKTPNEHGITALSNSLVFAGQNTGASYLIDKGRGTFGFRSDTNMVQIYPPDSSITTSAQFNAYLAQHPLTFIYEKESPTTSNAQPFENIQEVTPNYGTEEFVTTGIVPVGNNTQYYTRDIYGGTLDLVSGVLTVDRAMVDLGTMNFNYDSGGKRWQITMPDIYDYPSRNGNLVAEKYVADITASAGNEGKMFTVGKGLYIYSVDGTTLPSGNLIYPLASPQTYQLTPHQIQTLVGQNNIWSDAGEVEVTFNLPISNLLVKRQDASDVSGKWLTLYSQPITQASDMDFTYIDFLNQHGKTYRYALVPLLTQQQGDVDVEIEGGYTVSDDVLSVFDGVFIANSNGSQKLKAATEYGDLETNQDVGILTTIGGKYPFVVSNSNLNYHSGSISALIVPSDFYTSGDLDRLDIVERREAIEQFLTDKTAKILKDWNGNIWLITFVDNVEVSFVDDYGMGLGTLSAKWVEIGDVDDQTDLQQTGLI